MHISPGTSIVFPLPPTSMISPVWSQLCELACLVHGALNGKYCHGFYKLFFFMSSKTAFISAWARGKQGEEGGRAGRKGREDGGRAGRKG